MAWFLAFLRLNEKSFKRHMKKKKRRGEREREVKEEERERKRKRTIVD
jgi:hypothetical protein